MKASVETHILRILLVCILLLVGLILWVNLSPHLPDTTSVDVQSESYVIMLFEDGEVLSSKEKDAQIYPRVYDKDDDRHPSNRKLRGSRRSHRGTVFHFSGSVRPGRISRWIRTGRASPVSRYPLWHTSAVRMPNVVKLRLSDSRVG